MPINVHIVDGDLLDQSTEVIVNAWNRNIIPWWLLEQLQGQTRQTDNAASNP